MTTIDAATFAKQVNDYTISRSPHNSITLHRASKLLGYRDVTAVGKLVERQLMQIGDDGKTRTPSPTASTKYPVQLDGDIHFSVGTRPGRPHVACELQHAKLGPWQTNINDQIGKGITVGGFFRCLFEHPGFNRGADAHIFEIHPVRMIQFDGQAPSYLDVGPPEDQSIHKWKEPPSKEFGRGFDLNTWDAQKQARYDPASDSITFSHLSIMDVNYVSVRGRVDRIRLKRNSTEPSEFRFSSRDITAPMQAYCLKNTRAAAQLASLNEGDAVALVALRNIDLAAAIKSRYVINLLAISIN